MPRGRVPLFNLCTEWTGAIQAVLFCSLSAGSAQLESRDNGSRRSLLQARRHDHFGDHVLQFGVRG